MPEVRSVSSNAGEPPLFEMLLQEHDEALLALMMVTQRKGVLQQEKRRKTELIARFGSFLDDDANVEIHNLDRSINALDGEMAKVNDIRRERSFAMAELVRSKSASERPSAPPTNGEPSSAIVNALKAEMDDRFRKCEESLERSSRDFQHMKKKYEDLLGENKALRLELQSHASHVKGVQKDREEISALRNTIFATKQSVDAALAGVSGDIEKAIGRSQLPKELESLKEEMKHMHSQAKALSQNLEKLELSFSSEKTSVNSRIEQVDKRLVQTTAAGQTILHQKPVAIGAANAPWPNDVERRLAEHQQQLAHLFNRMERVTMREIAIPIANHAHDLVLQHPSIARMKQNSDATGMKAVQHDGEIASLQQKMAELDKNMQALSTVHQSSTSQRPGNLNDPEKGIKPHSIRTDHLPLGPSTGNIPGTPTSAANSSASPVVPNLGKGLFELPPRPSKRPRAE